MRSNGTATSRRLSLALSLAVFLPLSGCSAPAPDEGAMGADLGYLKYGIFPGDSRIFSITLAASPDDNPLRAAIRVPGFEALAAFLPATRAWVDPEIAERRLQFLLVRAADGLRYRRAEGHPDPEPGHVTLP